MKPLVLVCACLALIVAGGAFAAAIPGQPDPVHGKALAESLCSNCHLVGSGQEHVNADVPSFREIANVPGRTAGDIIAFIILPKHPMPTIPLTKAELADLAAYIISLRDQP
jgi:mono/diheme cytochrome c family protein